MDYNANINWIVAGQADESLNRLNILKSFYVKYERKLPALIAEFCRYYAHHKCKTVVYYYDTTALGSNYAVNSVDFRYTIIDEFKKHGWHIVAIPLGNPMRHEEKYHLINNAFAGKNRLTPYFNRQNNDDLILAVQSAGVTVAATASIRTNQAKNWPRPRMTASNSAPMAPTPSTPSTSAVRNSPTSAAHSWTYPASCDSYCLFP
ncbi:hypothetical protein [Duncaniella dubosii]|uniref:hypothetical protein n=1 Tax=Duncaniella dubosii TaxID=2518971 RepID=UPI001E31E9AE|nr:hypothetical protein [Duncaniella dubosii]